MKDTTTVNIPPGTRFVPFQRHSPTSRAAARRIREHLSAQQTRVLGAIQAAGRHGLTDNEGIALGVVGPNSWRARRVELLRAGKIVASGKLDGCTVWVAARLTRPDRADVVGRIGPSTQGEHK